MLFCHKNKVFVTYLLAFSLNKDKREIPERSSYFIDKKLTKMKWETQKENNAGFVLF